MKYLRFFFQFRFTPSRFFVAFQVFKREKQNKKRRKATLRSLKKKKTRMFYAELPCIRVFGIVNFIEPRAENREKLHRKITISFFFVAEELNHLKTMPQKDIFLTGENLHPRAMITFQLIFVLKKKFL